MKTILVEEWVHIPEGGKLNVNSNAALRSYSHCKDKIGDC